MNWVGDGGWDGGDGILGGGRFIATHVERPKWIFVKIQTRRRCMQSGSGSKTCVIKLDVI